MRATALVALALAALASSVAIADPALPMKSGAAAPTTTAASAGAPAASAAVPDGRTLLRQFIDACGGAKAFDTVRNVALKGSLSIPSQGMSGSVEIYQDKPNKVLAISELGVAGMDVGSIRMEEGFDGTIGWARDPMQGPRILKGAELEQLKNSGGAIEVFGYANADEYFTKAETLERTTFDGKDAWKVALSTKGGEDMVAYFDPSTALQLGMETKVNSPMGEMPVAVSFSDWKDFSGLKVPTRMTQTMMGMKIATTIESLRFNVAELPSFAAPPEVLEATE